ncbi:hypothetical protein AFV6_gp04 [Betalipothrixvirus pozzuoliense]|uniref:Uncharacterized protein n=1 Tax=Betalipothrixvirus pozzuoliense TaxID=346882 RepID=A7WKF9_9VIRU|nr:hypothetical protein AFV6_gp04 [Acidianus filamentous virus 6]CAJ31558.1 conserved hypothetical protein [Acidianus filamentous virus 6]
MPNPMNDSLIRKLVMEKLNIIRNSKEAYIINKNKEEKIINVELKETENYARIIITTNDEKAYVLTPAEFLRKIIRADNKVIRGI